MRKVIILTFSSRRIRDNEYEFPTERVISSAVQHLIQQILTPDPSQRPTLHEIVDHAFFTQGPVPSYIPTSAHDAAPDFRHISKSASDANLKRLRKYSLLDADAATLGAAGLPQSNSTGTGNALAASKSITTSIAQQEKEFQKAVQPGSPISALLSSARQPLLMGTAAPSAGGGGGGAPRESPLLRKLQAVKESPLGRRSVTRGLDGIVEEDRNYGSLQGRRRVGALAEEGEQEEEEMRLRKKELEAQKARIVAQMAPVREEQEHEYEHERDMDEDEEPMPPTRPAEKAREAYVAVGRENAVPQAGATAITHKYNSRVRSQTTVAEKENVHATG